MALDIFEKTAGSEALLSLVGELTVTTSPALEKELPQYLDSCDVLTIDMDQCTYISSAGIRVLMSAFKKLKARNAGMKLINVSPSVLEIFQYTGLDSVFEIHAKEE